MTITFESLGLSEPVLRALTDASYIHPTDVQAQAIPAALNGRDVRVCSHTGSGKTAAFIIPALEKLIAAHAARQSSDATEPGTAAEAPRVDRRPRRSGPRGRPMPFQRTARGPQRSPKVLVLAPTRELAMQVSKAAITYGRHVPELEVTIAVGGMPYPPQIQALRGPLDILIATPGRLIDHLERGVVKLDEIELLILDEADRMLDMGFIEDIERIAQALPHERQTIMVSATFAGNVGRLADEILKSDAQRIEVSGHTESHDNIDQQLMWADDLPHKEALLHHLLAGTDLQQAVVFTSTQRDADELAERLYHRGHAVAPLHGGMPQGRRNRTLLALRRGELRVLIATDVAARGIDVPTISHVINYGLPMKAEDYVHRIGRTGRAGRSGRAVTLAERRDAAMIRRIQQFTTQAIPVSIVAGLEPKRPAPRIFMDRVDEARRGPAGGPGRHHEPRHGGWGAPGGDRHDPRRADHRPARPHGPRTGGFDPRFEPNREDRSFEAPRWEGRGERDHRGDRPFEARGHGPAAPRGHGEHRPHGERPWHDRGPRGAHEGGRAPHPAAHHGPRGDRDGGPAHHGPQGHGAPRGPGAHGGAPFGKGPRGGQGGGFEDRGGPRRRPR